jgi:urease accessory protein
MERNCAVQRSEISVGPGAFLEYPPEANIPFGGSRLLQQTTVRLDPDAMLLCWDVLHPGRYAREEEFACNLYFSGMEIQVDGRPALIDTVVLEPGSRDPRAPGIMGGNRFAANVYVYARDIRPYAGALRDWPGFVAPPGLLVLRLLGDDWLAMSRGLDEIWRRFRETAGMPPPPGRKC